MRQIFLKPNGTKLDESGLKDSIELTCTVSTNYDKEMTDYSCTRPCKYPRSIESENGKIEPDWKSDDEPELNNIVNYHCVNSKMVSKADFDNHKDDAMMDDLGVKCLMNGKYDKGK